MSIELAGFTVFNADEQLLLVHRRRNPAQWEIPGGKIETDESAQDTAVREGCEELGIEIELTGEDSHNSFLQGGVLHEYSIFRAVIRKGVPTIQEPKKIDSIESYRVSQLLKPNMRGLLSLNLEMYLKKLVDGEIKI